MSKITRSISPTCTATIPLVPLPTSRLTAQPSTSIPRTSANASGSNAPAGVASAASPPAHPTSNLTFNTATTNSRPPSKPTRSKRLSVTAILAWIGAGVAVAGLILTIFYGKLTMLLARWTAGNDYRESCRNDRDDGVFLDEKCKEALSHPPKPPPIRKRELPLSYYQIQGVSLWELATGCVLFLLLLYMSKSLPTRPWSLASKVTRKPRSGPKKPNYISYFPSLPWTSLFFTLACPLSTVYYVVSATELAQRQLETDFRETCRSDPDLGLTPTCVATLGTPALSSSVAAWMVYDTNNYINWSLMPLLLTIFLAVSLILHQQLRTVTIGNNERPD